MNRPESQSLESWIEAAKAVEAAAVQSGSLRCTKSKISYAEALAKERDGLRVKLNKAEAELERVKAILDQTKHELEQERSACETVCRKYELLEAHAEALAAALRKSADFRVWGKSHPVIAEAQAALAAWDKEGK